MQRCTTGLTFSNTRGEEDDTPGGGDPLNDVGRTTDPLSLHAKYRRSGRVSRYWACTSNDTELLSGRDEDEV